MLLESVTALINNLFHEPQAGLLNGILFGVKATLDADLKQSLINSGTLHIIALSGMNISILVAIVNLVLLRLVRRPIANICTVVVIIGFISLVGVSASVLRAAIMGTITLLAVSLGRQAWPIFAWILAVVVMLVLNPLWIGDLSFQLSVMATLGIILFGSQKAPEATVLKQLPTISHLGNLSDLGKTLLSFVADDLRVSLAAQLFTVPIILFQFHRISLVSPLSNVLIGWLMAPIMVLGFATVAAGFLFWPLGQALAWFTWVPLTFVLWVIGWTGKLPFASISF